MTAQEPMTILWSGDETTTAAELRAMVLRKFESAKALAERERVKNERV